MPIRLKNDHDHSIELRANINNLQYYRKNEVVHFCIVEIGEAETSTNKIRKIMMKVGQRVSWKSTDKC